MIRPTLDPAAASRPLPGMLVRNPAQPGWGLGQVQSVVGNRITVNFEHVGKLLINGDAVTLEPVDPSKDLQGGGWRSATGASPQQRTRDEDG